MRLPGTRLPHEKETRFFRVREVASIASNGEIDLSQFPIANRVISRKKKVLERRLLVKGRNIGPGFETRRSLGCCALATDGT
jgi:hypothetical protein